MLTHKSGDYRYTIMANFLAKISEERPRKRETKTKSVRLKTKTKTKTKREKLTPF